MVKHQTNNKRKIKQKKKQNIKTDTHARIDEEAGESLQRERASCSRRCPPSFPPCVCVCVYGKQGRQEMDNRSRKGLPPSSPQDNNNNNTHTHTHKLLLHNNSNKHDSSNLHKIPI